MAEKTVLQFLLELSSELHHFPQVKQMWWISKEWNLIYKRNSHFTKTFLTIHKFHNIFIMSFILFYSEFQIPKVGVGEEKTFSTSWGSSNCSKNKIDMRQVKKRKKQSSITYVWGSHRHGFQTQRQWGKYAILNQGEGGRKLRLLRKREVILRNMKRPNVW